MFSAFSSMDYRSIRASTPAETAVKRLNGIGEVLSSLDMSTIHTQDDMTRALWTLDTADKCIRMILSEFRTAPAKEQVVREATRLADLIELARDEISNYRDRGIVLS
jgi:RPA family protein